VTDCPLSTAIGLAILLAVTGYGFARLAKLLALLIP
jgi:hypothetical protein